MIFTRKISVMVSFLALGLAACGGKSTQTQPRDAQEAAAGQQGPSEIPPAQGGQGAEGGPSAQTGTPLTQEQIVAITSAADSSEIRRAELAQSMAKSDKVKKLAEKIAKDHLAHKNKQAELAQRLRLAPVETPTSKQLESEGDQSLETLKAQRGDAFDRAYVDAVIRAHLSLLDLIDKKLIPSAEDADLRSVLQDYRSRVESHLKEAQDAQKDLASGK